METKSKKILLLAFTGLVILSALAVVAWDIATWQQRGWTGMTTKWEVVDFIFAGSPAQKAGFLEGDSILAVNGISVDSIAPIITLAAQTKIGEKYTYLVERDGRELAFTITLESPFQVWQVIVNLVSGLLVGLIFLVIGYFVYLKQPVDRRARIFCLMSVFAAAFFFMNSLFSLDWYGMNILGLASLTSANIFMIAGTTLSSFFLALLLMHLALIFPKERPVVRNNPYVFRWLYGFPALWSAPLATSIAIVLANGVGSILSGSNYSIQRLTGYFLGYLLKGTVVIFERGPIFSAIALGFFIYLLQRSKKARKAEGMKRWIWMRPLQSMFLILLLAFVLIGGSSSLTALFNLPKIVAIAFSIILSVILWGGLFTMSLIYPIIICVSIYRSYRESHLEEKRQVKWPLWGIILALAGYSAASILGTILVMALGRSLNAFMFTLEGVLGNAFYLIIPISFAIGILKYRLMDIDLIIKKTIIYSAVTGLIVLLYLGLVGGLGGFLVQYAGLQNQWMIVFSTLLVALVFVPMRNRVQVFIDRRFYRKKQDYPQILKRLSSEVHEAADQKTLLQCIAENLQQALPNRATVIFLKSQNDQNLWAKEKIGLPDEVLNRLKIALASPLVAGMSGLLQLSSYGESLPEADRRLVQQTRADLFVLVKAKHTLLGLISLGKRLSDQDYDEDDKDFLISVAELMAIGLEHVRLRKQEKEFEQARAIQQRLLPSVIPQIAGYEIVAAWQPAHAVSGDYYDVLRFSDGKLGVCIADVVGKGMPAALLMSNVQAAVKAYAAETTEPKDLCIQVNRFLHKNIARDQFITFFYCVLDAKKKSLTYSRAGHNEPILVRRDGSHCKLESGGPALGILSNYDFEQGEVLLVSSDRLLLFTDGVIEAMNAEGEEFGETRLLELLAGNRKLTAVELQKSVTAAVSDFTQGNFQDDVTMLVVEVE